MHTPNATLLIGDNKSRLAPVHFDGGYSPADSNGTITIPVSSGFKRELLNGPVFIDAGVHVYRITKVWEVHQQGDDYAIRCYAENAEAGHE